MKFIILAICSVIAQTGQMPSTPKPQGPTRPNPMVDACQSLKKPEHIKVAKALTGNERKLFCAIFDDAMRDETVAAMNSKPPKTAQEAVIDVARKNNLVFSTQPGDACPKK